MKSLIVAFHTYSRIPMPNVEWDDKSMKNAINFFPWVGIVIGLVEMALLHVFCNMAILPPMLRGAILAVVPILLTGGIHMDGFCDTTDALSSYQDREKKLEILKDSNAGAFAVIYACAWFVLYYGAWTCIDSFVGSICMGISFVLSRAFSGLGVAAFDQARKQGMLRSYADKTDKRATKIVMLVYIFICSAALVWFGGTTGAAVVLVQLCIFAFYRYKAYKEFGGITGDTAGWFLQLAELGSVLVVAIRLSVIKG